MNSNTDYEKNEKKREQLWLRFAVLSVVFLLVCCTGIVIFRVYSPQIQSGGASGLSAVDKPQYDVSPLTIPDEISAGKLYAATLSDTSGFDRQLHNLSEHGFILYPMYVFGFSEYEGDMNESVWYPVYSGGKITSIYEVTKVSDYKYTLGSISDEAVLNTLNVLSGGTDAESPLYLASDSNTVYAIVGSCAYVLCQKSPAANLTSLPSIVTAGLDIIIISNN